MDMKTYIEMGEKRAGKQSELAKYLNVRYTTIGLVKSGKRGLPEALCIKLARYIDEDEIKVIAASNLVTEKDEERRKIFESCFSRAASVTAAAIVISILTLIPQSTVNALNLNSDFTKIQIIGNWIAEKEDEEKVIL